MASSSSPYNEAAAGSHCSSVSVEIWKEDAAAAAAAAAERTMRRRVRAKRKWWLGEAMVLGRFGRFQ